VVGDVQLEGQFELIHAGETVSPDALVGDGNVAEEYLHDVRPRRADRGEVHNEAWLHFQPSLELAVALDSAVVHRQCSVSCLGDLRPISRRNFSHTRP